jgi:hypothetical protein
MGTQSITGITSFPGANITIVDKGGWTEEIWEPVPIAGSTGPATASSAGTPDWPILASIAYHGLAGDVVHTILPHTESDPVALLIQYLISFGNAVGRGPFYYIDGSDHFANLFGILVGDTAIGRKGTAANHVRRVIKRAEPDFARNNVSGGISSGEGIIEAVRDARYGFDKRSGEEIILDPGVDDKRLLIDEREFAGALEVMRRDGNIVSRIIREAWDCPDILRTMTKNVKSVASNPMISIIGHITPEELQDKLDRNSAANGYGNRFLYICVKRSKSLPHGGNLDPAEIDRLGQTTLVALTTARTIERVTMTWAARTQWEEMYPKLSERPKNLIGALTARAAPQTLRLAIIYTLLDGLAQIDCIHLDAALALWTYCEDSVHHTFVSFSGDPIADTILRGLLNVKPDGMSTWDINNKLFTRHTPAHKIQEALGKLLTAGKVRRDKQPPPNGRGRPVETWIAV